MHRRDGALGLGRFGRLMDGLFARGVIVVMTSNYPPDMLYPNGLHRESFLPTIALIKKHLDVFEVEAGIDYRLRALEQVEIYHYPSDASAEAKMLEAFTEHLANQKRLLGPREQRVFFDFIQHRKRESGHKSPAPFEEKHP